ncbi:MAG: dihydroorotase [Candidatus Melainabacteria bacterium]|nr:dihydroorotase [Candidatus Melainabacteria bacterium]
MTKLLIKNGRYLNPKTNEDEHLDLLVQNGKVVELKKDIVSNGEAKVIDAKNYWVVPGLIDIHCHLRDPGQPEKETIETGTRAAARGGFTSICPMANTKPPIDSAALVEYVNKTNQESGSVNIFQVAAVSKGLMQEEITPFEELRKAGAVAFSDDGGKPIENLKLLRHALEYAQIINANIISHAEDSRLCSGGVVHEGYWSYKLGIPGIPSASEAACVAREIELVKQTKGKIHFAHISTKEAVELIRQAQEDRLNVTTEVTPHHLVLIDEDMQDYSPNKKMNPPLRSNSDKEALIKAVLDGVISVFATDHAPHTIEEKSSSLIEAPFGIIGFETALPLYLEVFYHSKLLSPLSFIKMLTLNPAKILNIPRGSISVNDVADITIIDPDFSWTYDVNNSFSRSRNSPFHNRKLKGKALFTIVSGEVVSKN